MFPKHCIVTIVVDTYKSSIPFFCLQISDRLCGKTGTNMIFLSTPTHTLHCWRNWHHNLVQSCHLVDVQTCSIQHPLGRRHACMALVALARNMITLKSYLSWVVAREDGFRGEH